MKKHLLSLLALLLLTGCLSTTPSVTPTLAPPAAPLPSATLPAAQAFTYLKLSKPEKEAQVFHRFEMIIQTDGSADNPFDPTEVEIQVRFTSPEGQSSVTPAFWYQEFDRASLEPVGNPGWQVRFTPTKPGAWSAQAELKKPALQSESISFTVSPATNEHGFVRLNPQNPRYFAYDDGSFYFPVGVDMAWSVGDVLADYERWLDRFSQNGGNLIRLWMPAWGFGIEWKDTGLGNYTQRMKQAWLLDKVFEMAEARQVTIMLCLVNHGQFSETTNPEWKDNPYNAANGGPLAAPQDFVTDPTARDLFKRRLRYLAARWSYSTSLFAWEWWNEINWTPISDAKLRPWISEMSAYLRTLDPNQHLITHSTSSGSGDSIWKMDELQIAQLHDYSGSFLPWTLKDAYAGFLRVAPDKPVLVGEFGYSTNNDDSPYAKKPIHLHLGLWAAPFMGFAGAGMSWWWDTYIDPYNHWSEYKPVSMFFQGEDLTSMAPAQAAVKPSGATALVLQNDQRALVWIVNNAYNIKDAQKSYEKALRAKTADAWNYHPDPIQDIHITLKGLKDGNYLVTGYSPAAGEWFKAVPAAAKDGSLVISLADLSTDWAFKVAPAP